jgi:hypothetical protein
LPANINVYILLVRALETGNVNIKWFMAEIVFLMAGYDLIWGQSSANFGSI